MEHDQKMRTIVNMSSQSEQWELYLTIIRSFSALVDGRAEDSGMDNTARGELYAEYQNVIHLLRSYGNIGI